MKEDICSIPINDIFNDNDGCPICRMYELLESNTVKYILGAAKMEPDIRIQTNQKGFCRHHYDKMLASNSRLQLALILETHLEEYQKDSPKEFSAFARSKTESCYVCERIDFNFERLMRNMFVLFETEAEFREKFRNSPKLCFKHAKLCISPTAKKVIKKNYKEFESAVFDIVNKNVEDMCKQLRDFCEMYDYKNAGKAVSSDAKLSVERAVEFLI
ncbi:MAG: DUF6062 family protein [bacterium]|nr:DUF6062 family protein [bacterium]